MDRTAAQLASIFGLAENESKLYLASLRAGAANISDLAKRAGIPRTAAYEPVKRLQAGGFLSAAKVKKRTFFQATDPRELVRMFERKKVDLEILVDGLEQQISAPERKLAVAYYPGKDGVLQAADIWYDETGASLVKSWENPDEIAADYSGRHLYRYIETRQARGIKARSIIPADTKAPYMRERLANDRKELRETVAVAPRTYPLKAAIGVLGDTVFIHTAGDDPFAIMIRNRDIAATLSSIHDMVWDRYRPE